jgi:ATP-dependent helicase HrpB
VLEEKAVPVPDGPAAGDVLFEAARPQLTTFLNANAEAQNYLLRVNCLAEWAPELQLPRFDEERLQLVLQRVCVRSRSFNDLRKADWQAALQGMLDWKQTQQVESEAPERIQVPSGNRIRLVYAAGRPPVLAVRIQELFGLEQTPRVAGGRVPVLLHLLAPNMRPQQVTDDLASFWDTTYATVRKELKRRYPRHAWPEDPRSADPVRKRG